MADPKLTLRVDDGKGRELPSHRDPQTFKLQEVSSLSDLKNPGDYFWEDLFKAYRVLILSCPFCGYDSPLPTLIEVKTLNPLTLANEFHCGFCGQGFHVIEGMAIKSWGHLEFES